MKRTRHRALTTSAALISVGALTGAIILVTIGRHAGLAASAGSGSRCVTAAFPGETVTVAPSPTTLGTTPPGPGPATAAPQRGPAGWSGAWSTALQDLAGSPDRVDLTGRTVRQVVHPTIGGGAIRVRLANPFGTEPLRLSRVTVAVAVGSGSPELVPGTGHEVTFDGSGEVEIPPGGRLISDPVGLSFGFGPSLAIDVVPVGRVTGDSGHALAYATTFLGDGDLAGTSPGRAFTGSVRSWFWLEGIDVPDPAGSGAISVFGDSITEGASSTVDENRRWPDRLAARLRHDPSTAGPGVLNEGIGGNRVAAETTSCRSPSASGLRRFRYDVLDRPEVRTVVIALGINDVGTGAPATTVVDALTALADRAHENGLRVIGATLTPFSCDEGCLTPEKEQQRQLVNDWIRSAPEFDAVVDFDRVLSDPAEPERMRLAYDSGDHLHPDDAGMAAMAAAFDLSTLTGP